MRTEAEVRRALEDALRNGDLQTLILIRREIVKDIIDYALLEVNAKLEALIEKALTDRAQRQ